MQMIYPFFAYAFVTCLLFAVSSFTLLIYELWI